MEKESAALMALAHCCKQVDMVPFPSCAIIVEEVSSCDGWMWLVSWIKLCSSTFPGGSIFIFLLYIPL